MKRLHEYEDDSRQTANVEYPGEIEHQVCQSGHIRPLVDVDVKRSVAPDGFEQVGTFSLGSSDWHVLVQALGTDFCHQISLAIVWG